MRSVTRTVLQFLLGFVIVLVLSAFLAPWLASFLPFKFDRILRRCIMIGTLFIVGGLVWRRRESWGRCGLAWKRDGLGLFGKGFGVGILLVVSISVAQLLWGARFWQIYETDGWHWSGFFLKGLGAGVLIGTIEEVFFRGFLFLLLKDLWNTKGSLVATNLIYALVHFFPKGRIAMGAEPTAWDSFRLMGLAVLSPWQNLQHLPAILGLFLFGLSLSFVFVRTGSLFPSMGIHAGAVFSLKLNRRFLPEISEKIDLFSGTKNLYDGILGIVILSACCFFLKWSKPASQSGVR